MKTTFALCLALFAVSSAEAQSSRSQPVNGSVRGYAGGSQGGRGYYHSGHQGHSAHYRSHHGYNHWHGGIGYYGGGFGYGYPRYGYLGYGYPRYGYPIYGYPSYGYPNYGYYGGYGSGYPYYNGYGYYGPAATSGLLLGALAGGIIGHNNSHSHYGAWPGAVWGAGAGWLIGSMIDGARRPAVVQQAPVVQSQVQPAAPAQPQQVTIINNYNSSATPMGVANGMFGR